jgi:hypothetical protein
MSRCVWSLRELAFVNLVGKRLLYRVSAYKNGDICIARQNVLSSQMSSESRKYKYSTQQIGPSALMKVPEKAQDAISVTREPMHSHP